MAYSQGQQVKQYHKLTDPCAVELVFYISIKVGIADAINNFKCRENMFMPIYEKRFIMFMSYQLS